MRNRIIMGGILGMTLVCLVSLSGASNTGWEVKAGQHDPNGQFHQRYPRPFQDDITADQDVSAIKLTNAQQHQAKVWQLSPVEEKRYVALMQNRSGVFYQHQEVTPVEVLGFNARTDTERSYYAALDVTQQFAHLAKYFAYLHAYQGKANQLKKQLSLPVLRSFNTDKYSPYHYRPVEIRPQDTFKLFVHRQDEVSPVVAYLLKAIEHDHSVHLNIYFLDSGLAPQSVQAWAAEHSIPAAWVGRGKPITLDISNQTFLRLHTTRKLPVLVLIRQGKTRFVNTGGF